MKPIKFIISLFALLFAILAPAQTLTNYTIFGAIGKSKSTCVSPPFWYNSYGNYLAPGSANSNTWFYPVTNVVTITGNSNMMVTYVSDWGPNACGRGSITWTDMFYPNDTYRFSQFNPTNSPVPTNPIPLVSFGFRTNSP